MSRHLVNALDGVELTNEEKALGAFLSAMYDCRLDGGKMREAMIKALGITGDGRGEAQRLGANTGHGHVFPRPDGVKARCGGPAFCHECAIDLAAKMRKEATPPQQEQAEERPKPILHINKDGIVFSTKNAEESLALLDDAARQIRESNDLPQEQAAPVQDEAEFEVWQDGVMCAGSYGPREDAMREIQHYAAQYAQDGHVVVYEIRRTRLDPAMIAAAPKVG